MSAAVIPLIRLIPRDLCQQIDADIEDLLGKRFADRPLPEPVQLPADCEWPGDAA